MRKLYSIMLCAVVAAFCFSTAAKTFTVKVSDPNQVYVINPQTSGPVFDFDENNSYTFNTANFDESVNAINLSALSGNEIVSVLDENGNTPVDESIHFPNTSCAILIDLVADNSTVTVTTREKEKTFTTIIGDPQQIYVSYNYSTIQPNDGKWEIETTYSGSLSIYPNSGYSIASVKDENGNSVSLSGTYAYIYLEAGSTKTYTVEAYDLESTRTASFRVDIDGNPADVTLTRSTDYSTIYLSEASSTVKFNPTAETRYSLRHTNYSKSLYKVEQNGQTLELPSSYTTTYEFTVADGDVITVTTDYPDADVPVNFAFTNSGTEGVISTIRLDNDVVTDFTNGFTAKLGQSLNISFNTNDFDITSITLNGSELYNFYSYSTTLKSEEPLNFVITATPKPQKKVTVITNDPASFYMSTGYNGSGTIYTFTDVETEIEVSNSVYSLYLNAFDGYFIEAVERNGVEQTYFSSLSVADGDIIIVLTDAVVRDKQFSMYIHPSTDWSGYYLYTGYNTSLQRSFSYYDNTLPAGYSFYEFGNADMPIVFRGNRSDYSYDAMCVYLNGEEIAGQYGSYTFDNLPAEAVIKAYPNSPASYTVKYSVAEDVDVDIRHDHISAIGNPSTHNVFEGTAVHITPATVVFANTASDPVLDVTVNNVKLVADENGVFTFNVTGDSDVSITKSPDSVSTIEIGSDNNRTVYNLQGMEVGTEADKHRLPAGIYIIDGRKVRL